MGRYVYAFTHKLALLLLPTIAQTFPSTEAGVQSPQAPVEANPEDEEIVVTGSRVPRGSVIGDIEPEITLNAGDISSYGASDVGELLQELAPLTGGGDDAGAEPILLLDGRRISSSRELEDLPPEAIARIDILPEEVALKYGYRPDQKVVNFVLSRSFQAATAEVEALQATAGGRQGYEVDANYLRIGNGSRLSVDAEYERQTALFESERDLVHPDPDRTLLPASRSAEIGGTYNRTIWGNVSATLRAELEGEDTRAALGRAAAVPQRLLRDRSTRGGRLNYALNGDIHEWRWSLTGGYSRDWSKTLTDRDLAAGIDRERAVAVTQTLESEATASGELFNMPAGAIAATFKAGYDAREIAGESRRGSIETATELSRKEVSGQANLDVPVLDESAMGSISASLNAEVEQLSDFGTLTTLGYGFNWEPADAFRVIGSVSHEEGAPSLQQLGNPVLVTPNVRVLDLVTGRTVEVTRVDGGNPNLLADTRRTMKLALTLKPVRDADLTLLARFTDTRIENPTASFPTATPELEAAFPDRFERDSTGTLLRIDSRPVNFERSHRQRLRWGFNWSKRLKALPQIGSGERTAPVQGAQPGGSLNAGWPAAGVKRSAEDREGRVQLALFHTWRLKDTIVVRAGRIELDRLAGFTTDGDGGQPRHEAELRAGYSRNGLGARLNLDWQSGTIARAGPPSGLDVPTDLTFGALSTVNLRFFADLGQQAELVRAAPFFRGSRLTLSIANIFDNRLEVRDAAGLTPENYQPDLTDPLGRAIRFSFRKLFS